VTDAIDADVTAAATARENALLLSTPNPYPPIPTAIRNYRSDPQTSSPQKQAEFGV
jgi:hypothetical protein